MFMSANCLVIVESPNKVKSVQKYLDSITPDTYRVMASFGHICDLPKKDLGFDTKTFEPRYEVYDDKQDIVNNLKRAARSHKYVLMATDDDREGEAIAFHLARELKVHDPDRITFGAITKEALAAALKGARKIDKLKVDSQETRRLLDRIIGWRVSPVAREYVVPDSSMGRVQTAVLCLLVHLERSINGFASKNHYGVDVSFINTEVDPHVPWTANWMPAKWMPEGQELWMDRQSAEAVKSKIKTFRVTSVEVGTSESAPPAPLITSTLQRAAQKVLKISPTQTMKLAQRLYEAGAITYMRTDNPNLSPEAFVALRKYAQDNELPVLDKQRTFKSKANAQEAHEAIRPTSFALKKVGEGEIQDLYNLIWMRAVACQLKAATYDTREVLMEQEVEVVIDGIPQTKTAYFKARGRKQTYDGWQQLTKVDFSELEDEEKESMPSNFIPSSISVGDVLTVNDSQLREKKTAPPARLTASSLIGKLEAVGIGRPSTYASIVDTLEGRDYIQYKKQKIHVTERGMKIIDTMEDKFNFIDVGYTAQMEDMLDEISSGKPFFPILKGFWDEIDLEVQGFITHIQSTLPQHKCEGCNGLVVKKTTDRGVMWKCTQCPAKYADGNNKPGVMQVNRSTNFDCLECNRKLNYRKGSFQGRDYEYFQCSGVAETANKCFAKFEILAGSDPVAPDFEKYKEMSKFSCKICDRKLVRLLANKGDPQKERPFWICSGNTKVDPLCNAFYDDKNSEPDYEAFDLNHKYKCSECQGFLTRFKQREGNKYFWRCGNVPKNKKKPCGVFYDDLEQQPDYDKYARDHEFKCPNCNSYISLRDGKNGEVWRCSKKNSECGWSFGSDPLQPDIEAAKLKYIHKCPNCKIGYLDRGEGARGPYWRCVSNACSTFLADDDGKPDFESNNQSGKKKK